MELFIALVYLLAAFIVYKIVDRIVRIPLVRKVEGKYILITGCDSGFGHETAKRLDAMGCHVFATCLTERGETELRKQCSDRLCTLYMDVRQSDSIQTACELVQKRIPEGKGLWAFLNNAGIVGKLAPDDWLYLRDYQEALDVNVLGLIDVTRTFLPLLKRAGGGRIVNTSSMGGRCSLPKATPYCMSKYCVEAYSDSIRRQLKSFNVSVHLIEPGAFRTQVADQVRVEATLRSAWQDAPTEIQAEYGEDYMEQLITMGKASFDIIISDRLNYVVDAYEHALLGRYPRARYVIGWDAYLLIANTTWLPEFITDWIINTAAVGMQPMAVRKGQYRAHAH